MQTELLNRKRWETPIELVNAIFDYLEIFHNRRHRDSALGMRTPIVFELLHQTTSGAEPSNITPRNPRHIKVFGLTRAVQVGTLSEPVDGVAS
jgi:transposase InsO family protein